MSRRTNRGSSDFSLDHTSDDNVIRQTKSEPRRITPAELQNPAGEYFCPICQSVFYRKSWHNDARRFAELQVHPDLARMCPACHKTKHDLPEGIVTLSGLDGWPNERKQELLSLVQNVAERASKRDPMDRVIRMMDKGNEVQIYTTENQLAVAIGTEAQRAFRGDLNTDFGHRDNDIARVVWIARQP